MTISIPLADENKNVVAIVTISGPAKRHAHDVLINNSHDCRRVLEFAKNLPFDLALATVTYSDLKKTVVLNIPQNIKDSCMDLSHLFAKRLIAEAELPRRLIAPLPSLVPEDEIIAYTTVETIADVMSAPANTVLMFSDSNHDLLDCIVQFSALFGFDPKVLSGLPTADYDAQFESRTFKLDRVAYPTIVAELIFAKQQDAELTYQNRSVNDKEKEQYTRSNGSVKELKGFVESSEVDVADDSSLAGCL